MPYLVIYVPQQEDIDLIVFNDANGNVQGITDSGGGCIQFEIEAQLADWPINAEEAWDGKD